MCFFVDIREFVGWTIMLLQDLDTSAVTPITYVYVIAYEWVLFIFFFYLKAKQTLKQIDMQLKYGIESCRH